MKRSWCKWGVIAVLALVPATAMAQRDSEEREVVDARLEGYETGVTLPPASDGLTWVAFVFLAILCCGGLFKDAKRTHLD